MDKLLALILCISICCACSDPRPTADLVLHSGKVVTLDDADTITSAVAIKDGRILAVGGSEIRDRFEAVDVVDLEGRTVLPGFIDSHIHMRGNPRHFIDLTQVRSIEALTDLVARKAAALGAGAWITGYGWSEDELAEGRRPVLDDLDRAAPQNPVVLTRAGGHSAVCNSLVLTRAGIESGTPDPDNGMLERDADGHPNGIIRERQDIVTRLVPEADPGEIAASLTVNLRDLFALGITSIVQAADTIDNYPMWESTYRANSGTLPHAAVQVRWEGPDAIAITQQPNFTYTLEGRYVANLEGERLAHNNPLRTPMDHGVFVALSSDILPIGPLVGLYAAVTRKGRSGEVYGAGEALAIGEALRGYTRNGAWLTREEDIKGSIEPGKLADLIVLSVDPLTAPPESLLDARVLRTYLGGRLVFEG